MENTAQLTKLHCTICTICTICKICKICKVCKNLHNVQNVPNVHNLQLICASFLQWITLDCLYWHTIRFQFQWLTLCTIGDFLLGCSSNVPLIPFICCDWNQRTFHDNSSWQHLCENSDSKCIHIPHSACTAVRYLSKPRYGSHFQQNTSLQSNGSKINANGAEMIRVDYSKDVSRHVRE